MNSKIIDTEIGKNSKIWNFCNIYGANIGDNCSIGSYTEIQKDVTIGNNVIISSHSFICSLVTIESNVFIGHGVMTINDLFPPSKKMTGSNKFWKKILIKKNAVIGSNVTLMPITIGEDAIVAAGSVVINDVPNNCIVAGNPAKIICNDAKSKRDEYYGN
jgi:acetyltransferase-like isoleucine patch superfamily enzyme